MHSHRTVSGRIDDRIRETTNRGKAIADYEKALAAAVSFVESARANLTLDEASGNPTKYTLEEIDTVGTMVEDNSAWYLKTSAEQAKLGMSDDPILMVMDLTRRTMTLQHTVTKLGRKKAPRKAKVTTTTAEPVAESSTEAVPIPTPTQDAETSSVSADTPEETLVVPHRDEL